MTEPTLPHLPCRTKLAKHLSLHGLMQSALAHAAKMNPAYLSMLLSGRKPLTDPYVFLSENILEHGSVDNLVCSWGD